MTFINIHNSFPPGTKTGHYRANTLFIPQVHLDLPGRSGWISWKILLTYSARRAMEIFPLSLRGNGSKFGSGILKAFKRFSFPRKG